MAALHSLADSFPWKRVSLSPSFFFLFPPWRTLIHTWNNTGTNIWTVNTAVRATECWQASRVGCAKHSSDPQRVNILKAVNSSLEASQMWFRMRREQNKCGIEPKPNQEHSQRCITRQVIKVTTIYSWFWCEQYWHNTSSTRRARGLFVVLLTIVVPGFRALKPPIWSNKTWKLRVGW